MKADIHPKYFDHVEIKCSCGAVIIAGSTKEKMKTELCSSCHPFFTGQQKLVDTAGRVDKFQAKMKKASEMKQEKAKKSAEKKQPKVYSEKVVPEEVLQRAMQGAERGKWGKPLGDSLTEETAKEEIKRAQKAEAASAAKAKKAPAAKKKAAAVKSVKKKVSAKKSAKK